MADTVFPQENDGGSTADVITEQALGTSFAAFVGFQSVVADGLSLNADFVNDEVDISEGTAVIMSSGLGYIVSPDARNALSLPASSGTNHVFLSTDLSNDDDITVHIDTDDSAPTNPSVKLGTVDTANNETTQLNRSAGGGGIDVEEFGNVVVSGATAIDSGTNLDASDEGSGVARLDAADTRVGVRNSGTGVNNQPSYIDFVDNLSVTSTGDNGVEVDASGGGGSGGGFTDSGSVMLEAAGNDANNNYDLPVYVPDGQTVTVDEVGLSLEDATTDTGVSVKLLGPSGTSAGSVTLDSHPKYTTSPGVSYSNTSGSLQRVVLTVVNEGSTDYTVASSAADYVEFGLKWSVA